LVFEIIGLEDSDFSDIAWSFIDLATNEPYDISPFADEVNPRILTLNHDFFSERDIMTPGQSWRVRVEVIPSADGFIDELNIASHIIS